MIRNRWRRTRKGTQIDWPVRLGSTRISDYQLKRNGRDVCRSGTQYRRFPSGTIDRAFGALRLVRTIRRRPCRRPKATEPERTLRHTRKPVSEWCHDCWRDYGTDVVEDVKGVSQGSVRLYRGGAGASSRRPAVRRTAPIANRPSVAAPWVSVLPQLRLPVQQIKQGKRAEPSVEAADTASGVLASFSVAFGERRV